MDSFWYSPPLKYLKNTLSGVVERNTRLGISARRGNNLKESLVSKGLIETKEISTGSGRTVLTRLTKKGSNILGKLGYGTKNGIRRYGLIHEFWRDKVRRYYEKLGYEVTLEKKLNGERADLVVEKGKERIAIEIETGRSNAMQNIRKCLEAGFSMVVSVPINRKTTLEIVEKLTENELDAEKKVIVMNGRKLG